MRYYQLSICFGLLFIGQLSFGQPPSKSVFTISRLNGNEVAEWLSTEPITPQQLTLILVNERTLDTQAFMSTAYRGLPCRRIRFSKDYYAVLDKNGAWTPYPYDKHWLKEEKVAGKKHWIFKLESQTGEKTVYRRKGPLIATKGFIKPSLKNPIPTPKITPSYRGSLITGLEHGANGYPNNKQPENIFYTKGIHQLDAGILPIQMDYLWHSAHSIYRPLNYINFSLDQQTLRKRLLNDGMNSWKTQLVEMNQSISLTEQKNGFLNKSMTLLNEREMALQDSLDQWQKSGIDSLAGLNAGRTTPTVDSLKDQWEKQQTAVSQELAAIESKRKLLESQITQNQRKADSIQQEVAKHHETLLNRHSEVMDLADAGQHKETAMGTGHKKALRHLERLEFGRHSIDAGSVAGQAHISGGTVGYRHKKQIISFSHGNSVAPQNDSNLASINPITQNSMVSYIRRSDGLSLELNTFYGRGMSADRAFVKPLVSSSVGLHEKATHLYVEGALTNQRWVDPKDIDALGLDGLQENPQFAIDFGGNFKLIEDKVLLEFSQRQFQQGFRGIGYFQMLSGFREQKASIDIRLLKNKVNFNGFIQQFETQDTAYPIKNRQLGFQIQFMPIRDWSLTAGYFPVSVINDPLRRRSVIRQDLKTATSSWAAQLWNRSLRQTISVQNFSVFGDISPTQNQWMTSGHHHLQLWKGLSFQHSFNRNWGQDSLSTFNSQTMGVSISGPGTLTSQLQYTTLWQLIGRTKRLGATFSYRPNAWIVDFRIDWALERPTADRIAPELFWNITITRLLSYTREESRNSH